MSKAMRGAMARERRATWALGMALAALRRMPELQENAYGEKNQVAAQISL